MIWPECPNAFDSNGLALVLLTLPMGIHRSDARRHARSVLNAMANRLSPGAELVETMSGPQLVDSSVRISLSYAGNKVLIGMSETRELGVDIVKVEPVAEIDALSELYLPKPSGFEAKLNDGGFAQRWAELEACCKAAGLPLAEIDAKREQVYAACDLLACEQINGYRMALAVR